MLFFSVATYYPMLGQYYKDLGFSGTQIGILFSSATLITMLIQPVWGIICDKKGNCKDSFMLMHSVIIGLALLLPFIKNYWVLLIVMTIHFIFQCGLFPLLDTMIYKDIHDFGEIRLWGSIGFASMVLFSGKIAEIIGISRMFFLYSFFMIISLFIASKIKEKSSTLNKHHEKVSSKKLFKKSYILFLIVGFFIMGSFSAGGQYFSILFFEKQGSLANFGIAYFFIAISEVPFLKMSQKIIKRFGAEKIIFVSSIILFIRYATYGLAKTYHPLLYTSIIMGSFIGLLLPAVAIFIKEKTDPNNRAMAVTIYSAISSGLGPMIFQFAGGIIYDHSTISVVYLFLCILIIVGVVFSKLLSNYSKVDPHKHFITVNTDNL